MLQPSETSLRLPAIASAALLIAALGLPRPASYPAASTAGTCSACSSAEAQATGAEPVDVRPLEFPPEVLVIEPEVHADGRGYFVETQQRERYADAGVDVSFVQDNHSRFRRGVLR